MDLIDQARAGDEDAFRSLTERHLPELRIHCYRMLGSLADAEDTVQETLLAAWRGLPGFSGRASIRTWLYRIATNRCLNALRATRRRPQTVPLELDAPAPTRLGEVVWLEPYPDVLGFADDVPGPEARYEAHEAMSLAFVTALQVLAPRQRAALILCDVLGFSAAEAACLLESSVDSVNSALKRARASVGRVSAPAVAPGSPGECEVVERFTRAYEAGDVPALVGLLTSDVLVSMPPVPLEYIGQDAAARFFSTVVFLPGRVFRLVATRANGQPAFGMYLLSSGSYHANGLVVITLTDRRISAITRFDNGVLPRFGLPRTLP
jgi:RNA polymerase sigma-70 factor (TIGR02960 family)